MTAPAVPLSDLATAPPLPRPRLDAAALAALAALALVAACLLTYAPLTGCPNLFGPGADDLARPLADACGLGSAVLVWGATMLTLLYVLREPWGRWAGRAAGWLLLAAVVAAAADYAGRPFGRPVSAFGPGGALGADLRFTLDDALNPPTPTLLLILAAALGLTLAADGAVCRGCVLGAGCAKRAGREFVLVATLAGRNGDRLIRRTVRGGASLARRTARGSVAGVRSLRRRFRRKPPVPLTLTPVTLTPVGVAPSTQPVAVPPPRMPMRTPADVAEDTPVEIPITRPVPPPVPVSRPAPAPPRPPRVSDPAAYQLPPLSLLTDPDPFPVADHEQKLRDRAALLEKTFADFNLAVKVVGIHTGPVITQYEVSLDTGLRLNKVTNLADDLALCLGVAAVRVVAPLPGRTTVGIEVPNEHRQIVRLKELIDAAPAHTAKYKLPIYIGKDVEGRPLVYDMADMPHLLIAGRTGTGKSVCLNSVILSFLYTRSPEECRLILIDPKKVELSEYGRVPHLMHPVVTDDKKAEAILTWAVGKMEERYELFRRTRVRQVAAYNELGRDEIIRRFNPDNEEERQALPSKLPYIVIVVDEVGDLLMGMKKEVEASIIRLAQKSRAAGVHLILATQKPTVDVVTGLIKSNLPARICFQVASRADSAVVLDEKGADKLLGKGDMLFLQPGTSTIIRAQGAYVDDREIERTVDALAEYETEYEDELLNLKTKDAESSGGGVGEKLRERDPLYEQAVEVVIREQRGSTSLLQRALGIGYGKASRFIDFMHEDGLVGAYNGSNARDVLLSSEEWAARRAGVG